MTTTPLRALLAAVLTATVLGACGQDETGTISDPPPPSQPSGSNPPEEDKEPTGNVDYDLYEMVTETAVGGKVDPMAVPLGDQTAVAEFAAQFETDAMRARLLSIVDHAPVGDGEALYAAVVAIGCEVPEDVIVTNTDSGLEITTQKTTTSPVQCFAPMTTVALVIVAEDVVG
ncbi:MAG: hypothetical protein M3135_05320 [Actinomycetota bacterium]|nr:hypothetical protein [Actinomycetota bacterium]